MPSIDKKIKQDEASINYLTEQVAKTGYTEIRKVVADLAQREMQKMTLIEATDHYVFDVIDPPAVMEKICSIKSYYMHVVRSRRHNWSNRSSSKALFKILIII